MDGRMLRQRNERAVSIAGTRRKEARVVPTRNSPIAGASTTRTAPLKQQPPIPPSPWSTSRNDDIRTQTGIYPRRHCRPQRERNELDPRLLFPVRYVRCESPRRSARGVSLRPIPRFFPFPFPSPGALTERSSCSPPVLPPAPLFASTTTISGRPSYLTVASHPSFLACTSPRPSAVLPPPPARGHGTP